MIKLLNNQRGAALVLVLGIIMLIMIFTTVLAAQMTNTQQQIKITDNTIDARNIARMGLDRVGNSVEKAIKAYQQELKDNKLRKEEDKKSAQKMAEELTKDLEDIPGVGQLVRLDNHHSYEIVSISNPKVSNVDSNMKVIEITARGHGLTKEPIEEKSIIKFTEY